MMRVLGIETTCDETAAAVVRLRADGSGEILSDEVMSQIVAHAAFGGVVPEIAARAHVEIIDSLIGRALTRAKMAAKDLDGVAAAAGPGLIGGVLVGLMAGKGVALASGKPFVAVNHLEAHALTARSTDNVAFPYLSSRLGRTHADPRGQGRRRLRSARRDDGRRDRRSLRQDRQDAGAALSRRPGGRSGGERRRPECVSPCPALCSADRTPISRCPGSRLRCALRPKLSRRCVRSDVADLCASFQAAVVDVVEDRIRVGLKLFRQRLGVAPRAVVVAGGVGRQHGDARGADAVLRRGRSSVCRAPAKALHRQRRDDRLGGHRAIAARNDRWARRPGPAALAARSQIRARAQQQGLKSALFSWA